MMNVLIVDDEAPARQRMRRLLQPMLDEERVAVAGEAADAVEALELMEREPVDLLLLDIRMPEMSGFDLLGRLDPEDRPEVVFTTAYDRYALRAFEANAIDYLLKPISQERLAESVARAERILDRPARQQVSSERLGKLLDWVDAQQNEVRETGTRKAEASLPRDADGYARQIPVSHRNRIRLVPTEQIVAVEINEGITRLFTEQQDQNSPQGLRQHVVDYTLDTLEANLDPAVFARVHRSAIVKLDCIREMVPWQSGRYKLILSHDHEVIASRDRSRQLRERLML